MKISSGPLFVLLMALFSLSLVACGGGEPLTQTPQETIESTPIPADQVTERGFSTLTLPDGSRVLLQEDADVEIMALVTGNSDVNENKLLLNQGLILVFSEQPDGTWFTVENKIGGLGRVTGSIMLFWFDVDTGEFIVVCISGICQVGSDPDNLIDLESGSYVRISSDGELLEMGNYEDLDFFELFEDVIIPTEEPAPTETGTPIPEESETPDQGATATAACTEFHSEFPLTPCPTLEE